MRPPCPSPDALLDWVAHRLDAAQRERLERHIDECEGCRVAVSELVRDDRSGPRLVAPGEFVGRYEVVSLLGAGAMGVVFEARDSALDRRVALKMVRRKPGDEDSFEKRVALLAQEAQAMARVSHANVVPVFDVGAVEQGHFIAMELVPGARTLREWLATHPSREERRRVCLEMGEGLAAIHAAGLVHCDFKPDNVLIDARGVARVSDFGLASTRSENGPVGTLTYAAPEQRRREAVDARADQYAWAVTAIETLSGAWPDDAARANVSLRESGGVKRTLARALSERRDARFTDLKTALEELRRGFGAPARRARVAVAAALVCLLAAGAWAWTNPARRCREAATRIDSSWNDAARSSVRQAFAAVGTAWAPDIGERVVAMLDAQAADWKRIHLEACDARWDSGTRSQPALEATLSCLAARRVELEASVAVLQKTDVSTALRGVAMATPPVAVTACEDEHALAALRGDVDQGPEASALRREIAEVWALRQAGQAKQAFEHAQAALPHATAGTPLEAEVQLALGILGGELEAPPTARTRLKDAVLAADRAKHDRARARALIASAFYEAQWESPEASERAADDARAVVGRLGGDAELEARLENAVGVRLVRSGKFRESVEAFEKARDLWLRAPGHRTDAANAWNNISVAKGQLDDVDGAAAAVKAAIELSREAGGDFQAELPRYLITSGAVEHRRANYDEAAQSYRQAAELLEATAGPKSPGLILPYVNLAMLEEDRGQFEPARKAANRALELAEALDPDGNGATAARAQLSSLELRAGGDAQRALTLAQRVLAQRKEKLGPTHQETLEAALTVARALSATGQAEAAAKAMDEVVAQCSPELLCAVARLHRGSEAIDRNVRGPALQRALDDVLFAERFYLPRSGRDAWAGGTATFYEAKARWALGDQPAARAAAERAAARFKELGALVPADVAELEEWRRRHP